MQIPVYSILFNVHMDMRASVHTGCETKREITGEEQDELRKGGEAMWHMAYRVKRGHRKPGRLQGGPGIGEKQERMEKPRHNFKKKNSSAKPNTAYVHLIIIMMMKKKMMIIIKHSCKDGVEGCIRRNPNKSRSESV